MKANDEETTHRSGVLALGSASSAPGSTISGRGGRSVGRSIGRAGRTCRGTRSTLTLTREELREFAHGRVMSGEDKVGDATRIEGGVIRGTSSEDLLTEDLVARLHDLRGVRNKWTL